MLKVTLGVEYDDKSVTASHVAAAVVSQLLTVTDPTGGKTMTREPADIKTIILEPTLPGNYTASLQAQDAAGKNLGEPVTDSFTVPELPTATVTLSVPIKLTATVPEPVGTSNQPNQPEPSYPGYQATRTDPSPSVFAPKPAYRDEPLQTEPLLTGVNRETGEPVGTPKQPPVDDAHVARGSSLFSDPSKIKEEPPVLTQPARPNA